MIAKCSRLATTSPNASAGRASVALVNRNFSPSPASIERVSTSLICSGEASARIREYAPKRSAAAPETRLEFEIGFDLQVPRAELRFAVLPWVVLGSGATTAPCSPGCGPIELSQTWGLSVLFSPSLGADFFTR